MDEYICCFIAVSFVENLMEAIMAGATVVAIVVFLIYVGLWAYEIYEQYKEDK